MLRAHSLSEVFDSQKNNAYNSGPPHSHRLLPARADGGSHCVSGVLDSQQTTCTIQTRLLARSAGGDATPRVKIPRDRVQLRIAGQSYLDG